MAKAPFQVWDMRTRANIFTLTGHTSTVGDVKTQDSDPQIISGSMDSTVRFVYSLKKPFSLVVSLSIHATGYGILLLANA